MLKSPSVNLEKKKLQIFSNRRKRIVFYITLSTVYILGIFIIGLTMNPDRYAVNYS